MHYFPLNHSKIGKTITQKSDTEEVGDPKPVTQTTKNLYNYKFKCFGCKIWFNEHLKLSNHIKICQEYKKIDDSSQKSDTEEINDPPNDEEEVEIEMEVESKVESKVEKEVAIPSVKVGDHKCKYCNQLFNSQDILTEHIMFEHPNSQLAKLIASGALWVNPKDYVRKCDYCELTFKNSVQLQRHVKDSHPSFGLKDQKCEICDQSFHTHKFLTDHIKSVHENPGYKKKERFQKCQFCEKTFFPYFKLLQHMKTEHKASYLKCPHCPKSFQEPSKLKYHIKIQHDKILDFSCEFCDKKFAQRRFVTRHIEMIHKGNYRYICKYCDKGIIKAKDLDRHIRVVHGESKKAEESMKNQGTGCFISHLYILKWLNSVKNVINAICNYI